MPARRIVSSCALGAVVLVGCGAPSFPAPPRPAAVDPCLVTEPSAPRDTLRVALLTPVTPADAPVPATDAERLVFRQLYETLVRVDCAGAVRPGLATGWRREGDGSRWVFELAADARFWDGTPVDAAAVRAAWRTTPGLVVADVRRAGDRTVEVSLSAPRPLEAFGDAAWSVVKRIPESTWPLGTGPVWVGDGEVADGTRVLRAVPTPFAPAGTPVLEFRTVVHADPRDVLDRAVDLLVTRDARALRYASGREDWRTHALPWDRVYVLASPLRLRRGTTTQLDSATRVVLARDAVRDDARAPMAEPWWGGAGCASEGAGPGVASRPSAVVSPAAVAPADDRVAADLVARLVARADAGLAILLGDEPDALRAQPTSEFPQRLARGDAAAAVFALPAHPLDACRAAARLRAGAPWLHAGGAWSADAIAPLVETRAHLLLRGVGAVTLDRDGGVRLLPGRHP